METAEARMLNIQTFLKGFHLFKENFDFDNSKSYTEMVYNALKDKLTDERFLKSCNSILASTSKDDWNKAYGFKGRPAIKDWLNAMVPQVIEKSRYVKCKITGAMLKEIYFDYPDDYLQELNQQKGGKIEASSSLKKENRLPQLNAIKTNLFKKNA
jgi:hypothetical protein